MALRFVGLLGHLLDQRISHLPTKITPFFKQFSFTLIWRTYGLGQRTISHQIEATYFMNKLSWEARLEDSTTEGAPSWSVGWEELPCVGCRRGRAPKRPGRLPPNRWSQTRSHSTLWEVSSWSGSTASRLSSSHRLSQTKSPTVIGLHTKNIRN
jgi:hypothetical protein